MVLGEKKLNDLLKFVKLIFKSTIKIQYRFKRLGEKFYSFNKVPANVAGNCKNQPTAPCK